jgi:hypothetical protein
MIRSTLLFLLLCAPAVARAQTPSEASALIRFEARESHRPAYNPDAASEFKASDHVFIQSALAVDFTYRQASHAAAVRRSRFKRSVGLLHFDRRIRLCVRPRSGYQLRPNFARQRVVLEPRLRRSKTA